jgi:hypothetical protein
MGQMRNIRRLTIESFQDSENKEFVERFAPIYDELLDELTSILNGNIDDENVNGETISVSLIVDSTGRPVQTVKFTAETGLVGTRVINQQNLTNTTRYPNSGVNISWTASGTGSYTINHITGLTSGDKWKLTIELKYK